MTKSLTVYFVRHTAVKPVPKDLIYGQDVPIDLSNIAAFQSAAEVLPPPNNALWFSSPFPRAIATANKILETQGSRTELQIIDAFQEQNFRDWVGKSKSSLRNDAGFKIFLKDPLNAQIPNGESGTHFHARVSSAIGAHVNDMKERQQNTSVILCHAGVIRNVQYYQKQLPKNPKDLLGYNVDYVSAHKMEFN